MAISGVANADVESIANALAKSRQEIAKQLNNFSYRVPTLTPTDQTGHVLRVSWTNLLGPVKINWGDGTIDRNLTTSPQNHTYTSAGSKTARVTAYAFEASTTLTIA